MDEPAAPIEFACPRCHADVVEAFYGPCRACRHDLRGSQAGEAREVASDRFEPTVHVTPNAVALKDD
ncbi:MAG: hypothetical protein M3Y91_02980 [Actinomycetota bacterium]|nr:hypothetical protein [Actinomycetota bacterium]